MRTAIIMAVSLFLVQWLITPLINKKKSFADGFAAGILSALIVWIYYWLGFFK
jgi:hypothetical protein